jgi:hypothetical protein
MVMEVARTKNLDALPYDVFYQIISELDCFDYNHLARVNRRCYAILENDYLAKRSVEVGGSLGRQLWLCPPNGPLRR